MWEDKVPTTKTFNFVILRKSRCVGFFLIGIQSVWFPYICNGAERSLTFVEQIVVPLDSRCRASL